LGGTAGLMIGSDLTPQVRIVLDSVPIQMSTSRGSNP
jgi:hypothetical protein